MVIIHLKLNLLQYSYLNYIRVNFLSYIINNKLNRLMIYKLLVFGIKTPILTNLCFNSNYLIDNKIITSDFFNKTINIYETKVRLQIWDKTINIDNISNKNFDYDTNIYHFYVPNSYLVKSYGIILVYDITNLSSFNYVKKMYEYITNLPVVNKDNNIFILGYKSSNTDRTNKKVTQITEYIKNFYNKSNVYCFEISNNYIEILNLFKIIVATLDNNLSDSQQLIKIPKVFSINSKKSILNENRHCNRLC